jgi:hypothetical protein
MSGRTILKHARAYIDGYDLSGYTRSYGPLEVVFDEHEGTTLTDGVKNILPGHARLSMGTLNGVFDNTATSGIHTVLSAATGKRTVMLPIGMRGAPAAGDPVFCGEFEQLGYLEEGEGMLTVSAAMGMWSARATSLLYDKAWGLLLHAKAAATAANSTTGAGIDNGAASASGGYFAYMVFSGDGTATLSVDDSADDSSYSALSGATSGSIDCSSVQYGIVALGTTATVRQYLRWQIALGTATTVTFASAFVRA